MNKLLPLGFIFFPLLASAQSVFLPAEKPVSLQATRISQPVAINGRLDEAAWRQAARSQAFVQVEPDQGDSSAYPTVVRILYDEKNLYIGAVCYDPAGRKGVRVPNLQRDFSWGDNDIFGIAIDAFNDKRNALSFQATPYGSQRDKQVFDDDFMDNDWDTFWKVRTSITDSGWVAEFQIPWASLRYPKENNTEWNINFFRRLRRINQIVTWSPYPRAYSPYRMAYAGKLTGLAPPPPSRNFRLQPYLLGSVVRSSTQNAAEGKQTQQTVEWKAGGELKYALTPSSVLDLTFNTDFAQTDVDRQVVNLTRFSVFFPERRQFFLENSGILRSGWEGNIEPFFSRRIGLDDAGNAIPIDAGVRYTSRTNDHTFGLLAVRQRPTATTPLSNFLVSKYSQNIGSQNRVGALLTSRYDAAFNGGPPTLNNTVSLDGFFRPNQNLSINTMLSGSGTTGGTDDSGFAGYAFIGHQSNAGYIGLIESVVSENYNPAAGFVFARNLVTTSPAAFTNYRPAWKPKAVRQFEVGFESYFYHRYDNLRFEQGVLSMFPVGMIFQSEARLFAVIEPNWQNVLATDSVRIAGIGIGQGNYQYWRYGLRYNTDPSKKWNLAARLTAGGFYNGYLNNLQTTLRLSPLPNISLSTTYELNDFRRVGTESKSRLTHLLGTDLRLAWNPRLQLIGFYQYNSSIQRSVWNVRLSWEFQPLSFLFVVFNENQFMRTDRINARDYRTTVQNQSLIGKISYLKQF